MATGVGPIKQSFVRALRNISALKAAVGSDNFYEGIALTDTDYPYVIYSVGSAYRSRQFGTEGMMKVSIDCWVVSDDQVQAHNLDQLLLDGMEDVKLDFTLTTTSGYEPSSLLCHRIMDMSFADLDDAGNKIYRVGGNYQIWTDRL